MTDKYRVVCFRNQGFGYLGQADWDRISDFDRRERVRVLAICDIEADAEAMCARLPQGWQDKPGLHYTNGEWWSSTGETIANSAGQAMELFAPADRPVPVVLRERVTQEHARIVRGKRPSAMTCADRRVLALASREVLAIEAGTA